MFLFFGESEQLGFPVRELGPFAVVFTDVIVFGPVLADSFASADLADVQMAVCHPLVLVEIGEIFDLPAFATGLHL